MLPDETFETLKRFARKEHVSDADMVMVRLASGINLARLVGGPEALVIRAGFIDGAHRLHPRLSKRTERRKWLRKMDDLLGETEEMTTRETYLIIALLYSLKKLPFNTTVQANFQKVTPRLAPVLDHFIMQKLAPPDEWVELFDLARRAR